jgi:5-methylcytosine-specific restriction protein A
MQDEAFTEFLRQKANEAEALGYRPNQFKQMLNAQGGEATVRQLLSKGKPTEGFTRLWELGRLDLTVEALAVESYWRPFIDDALLQQAERLLRQSKYTFTPFTESAAPSPSSAATMTVALPSEPVHAPLLASKSSPPPSASATSAASTPMTLALAKLHRRPQNSMTFSKFCAWLGAPLVNVADRWCGYNPQRSLGVFNLWADRLQGDRYLLWNDAVLSTDSRIGAKELRRVLLDLMAAGHAAYGILCEAEDIDAATRKRSYFDEQELLVLRLEADGADIVAHVLGTIPAADVAAARHGAVAPFDSAIDDLDIPPPGQVAPNRTPVRGGTGYRRDAAVRSYVIQRSKGRCEHCGVLGFEMADGSFYVEAHHVIALSAQGPDTVDNVIALCPEHHRQAHYGKSAEALEAAFLTKLRSLGRG